MVDRFEELRTYVTIVEAGGVNAAASRIGIARSAVSRRLSDLETRLGATLVDRSTRRFELTDTGRAFLEDSKRVLAELAAMDTRFSGGAVAGTLTVAVDRDAVPMIAAGLIDFRRSSGSLSLRIVLANESEAVSPDVVVTSTAGASGRQVGSASRVVVGALSYFEAQPRPKTPADLAEHTGISVRDTPSEWTFRDGVGVRPTISLSVPDTSIALALAVAGGGLAHLPRHSCEAQIESGALIAVLEGHEAKGEPVIARAETASLTAASLVDHLAR